MAAAAAAAAPSIGAETIKVVARVRPLLRTEDTYRDVVIVRGDTITVNAGMGANVPTSKYKFDRVFGPLASQEDVFAQTEPLILAALSGYNSTVFAYGQTGTGKTHTMLGVDMWRLAQTGDGRDPLTSAMEETHLWGIIPRSMQRIFDHVEQHQRDTLFNVKVSYLEIYNERVFDLLRFDDTHTRTGPGLRIHQDKHRGVFVPDAVEVPVTNAEEVLTVLWKGAKNRAISATDMNLHSSRSHTIFQVCIEQQPLPGSESESDDMSAARVLTRSKLNLVDLAGSEKMKSHQSFSERRIAELTSINQSLSNLGHCVRALAEPGRRHIPYRNSKLTRLLQDSLGGNTKTTFVVTLTPSEDACEETQSTLQFADRAKRVVVHAMVNETLDDASVIRRQEHEISRLRAMLDAALKAGGPPTTPKSPAAQTTKDADGRAPAEGGAGGPGLEIDEVLREENQQLQEQVSFLRQALIASKEEASLSSQFVHVLKTRFEGDEVGDLAEAWLLSDARASALDKRSQQLEEAADRLIEKQQIMDKYHRMLRSIPVEGVDAAGSPTVSTNSNGSSPTAMTAMSRLALLEWSVLRDREELYRVKRQFMVDNAELDNLLLERGAQLDELHRKLQAAETTKAAQPAAPAPAGEDVIDEEAAAQWTHHIDPTTQRSYYHNAVTGSTQWERPADLDGRGTYSAMRRDTAQALERLRVKVAETVRDHVEGLSAVLAASLNIQGSQEDELVSDQCAEMVENVVQTHQRHFTDCFTELRLK